MLQQSRLCVPHMLENNMVDDVLCALLRRLNPRCELSPADAAAHLEMPPQRCALVVLFLLVALQLAVFGAAADGSCGCPLCGASYEVPPQQASGAAAAAAQPALDPLSGSSPHQHDDGSGSGPADVNEDDLHRCGGAAEPAGSAVPPPAGPPPGPLPADAAAVEPTDSEALALLLDKPPTSEFCEALTAAVNAQVGICSDCLVLE